MKLQDIHIRDPFIMPLNGTYYLYGSRCQAQAGPNGFAFASTGLDVYTSTDLETWSEAHECFTRPQDFWSDRDFWAPEVHAYQGAYYMFVSFKSETHCRGTQILRSESPMGPFLPISDGPVTPENWECLDGTLFVDDAGTPWIVFCHEWVQIHNGTICALQLTADLTAAVGEPKVLFCANAPAWVRSITEKEDYVTDGPYLWRAVNGQLLMLWSSFSENYQYGQAVAVSESGTLAGPWKHSEQPLFEKDGGHGMLFHSFDGTLYLVLHRPNESPDERPCLLPVQEVADGFRVL